MTKPLSKFVIFWYVLLYFVGCLYYPPQLYYMQSYSLQHLTYSASPKRAGNLLPQAPRLRHNVGRVCGADMCVYLFRVTNIRFSKCSDGSGGIGTQPLDIRHPWLRSRSRQRPVAELLGSGQSIKEI